MEQLFLNKDLSLVAQEKGFKQTCFGFWFEHPTTKQYVLSLQLLSKVSKGNKAILAPLYQQLIDWFREQHGILIEVRSNILNVYYYVVIPITPFIIDGRVTEVINPVPYGTKDYKDYYKALEGAIEQAFKLI